MGHCSPPRLEAEMNWPQAARMELSTKTSRYVRSSGLLYKEGDSRVSSIPCQTKDSSTVDTLYLVLPVVATTMAMQWLNSTVTLLSVPFKVPFWILASVWQSLVEFYHLYLWGPTHYIDLTFRHVVVILALAASIKGRSSIARRFYWAPSWHPWPLTAIRQRLPSSSAVARISSQLSYPRAIITKSIAATATPLRVTVAVLFAVARWRAFHFFAVGVRGIIYGSFVLLLRYQLQQQGFWYTAGYSIFFLKLAELSVHAFWYYVLYKYKPTAICKKPTYTTSDATVIIPLEGPPDVDFASTLESVIRSDPQEVIVVSPDQALTSQLITMCAEVDSRRMRVLPPLDKMTSRERFILAVSQVRTRITVCVSDRVTWPPKFLTRALVPFEDRSVAQVVPRKRVLPYTDKSSWSKGRILHTIATMAQEGENFDCATNWTDGGLPVVSPGTALVRTEILKNAGFQRKFLNEWWFFGLIGPLESDDSDPVTEIVDQQGLENFFLPDERTAVTLNLPECDSVGGYLSHTMRQQRRTWRSTISLLSNPSVWQRQFWTIPMVHLSWIFNISFISDWAMFVPVFRSGLEYSTNCSLLVKLVLLIVASRAIKISGYLWRHPRHILLLPLAIPWGWVIDFIHIGSGLTAYKITGSGKAK